MKREVEIIRRKLNMNIFNNSYLSLILTDEKGKIYDINKPLLKIVGYTKDEVLKKNIVEFYANLLGRDRFLKEMKKKGFVKDFITEIKSKKGEILTVCFSSTPIKVKGKTFFLSSIINITKIKKFEEQLLLMKSAVDDSPIGTVFANLTGEITYTNRAFLKMVGYSTQKNVLGRSLGDFCDRPEYFTNFLGYARRNKRIAGECEILKPDGSQIKAKFGISSILEFGVVQIYLYDITKQYIYREKLKYLNRKLGYVNRKLKKIAYKDFHTGLFTFRVYEEFIRTEFQRAKRYGRPLSMILIDVDFFKAINDVYGYPFGDLVLKQLAEKFASILRGSDLIARFGGEEFLIVFPETPMEKAIELGKRIFREISETEFGKSSKKVKLKISGGLVSYPEDKIKKHTEFLKIASRFVKMAKLRGGMQMCSSYDTYFTGKKGVKGKKRIENIAEKLLKLSSRMEQVVSQTLFEFIRKEDKKDRFFIGHSKRVSEVARDIARKMNLAEYLVVKIEMAAFLCNVGKIGISPKLLEKKTRWSEEDMERYKKHIDYTIRILSIIPSFSALIPIVRHHHEKWDGQGYPDGLKEGDIPMGSRIIAVADAYIALISKRPQREAFSKKEALKIINSRSGKDFDPDVVKALKTILNKN